MMDVAVTPQFSAEYGKTCKRSDETKKEAGQTNCRGHPCGKAFLLTAHGGNGVMTMRPTKKEDPLIVVDALATATCRTTTKAMHEWGDVTSLARPTEKTRLLASFEILLRALFLEGEGTCRGCGRKR